MRGKILTLQEARRRASSAVTAPTPVKPAPAKAAGPAAWSGGYGPGRQKIVVRNGKAVLIELETT
ncbi:hypothetical protein [Nonomuraea typhae]|uniref:Uncharacterized protein n=1 Tax=Nonomuraea typhae TaxID=2603600 RepID=A0ABW7YPR2_9ACTN